MEKLWLTSFVFMTGENQYEEKRLISAIEHETAYDKLKKWFSENYPESDLLQIVVHDIIS